MRNGDDYELRSGGHSTLLTRPTCQFLHWQKYEFTMLLTVLRKVVIVGCAAFVIVEAQGVIYPR